MADKKYTLLMQLGPKQGETVAVMGEEYVMGRDASCDWAIEDIEVSRRHARLILENGDYSIEDLGSTNGTFVNGQRIRTALPLLPGATIRLGENVLLFFDSTSAENDSTKTLKVEKEEAAPEAQKAPQELPEDKLVEEKQSQAEDASADEKQTVQEMVEEVRDGELAIQEMKAASASRRERLTSLPIFGNQIGLGVIAIAAIGALALIAFLWYVDANFLWCDVFGNLISACR